MGMARRLFLLFCIFNSACVAGVAMQIQPFMAMRWLHPQQPQCKTNPQQQHDRHLDPIMLMKAMVMAAGRRW